LPSGGSREASDRPGGREERGAQRRARRQTKPDAGKDAQAEREKRRGREPEALISADDV